MHRLSWRCLTLLGCVLGATLTAYVVGAPHSVDGPLFDVLVAIRARLWTETPAPPEPVAVIALDQRSLDAPALAPYPRTFLAPVWAMLLESVFTAGARAVGFDVLFAYTANRFIPNFDAPFLAALDTYRHRVVLARSATTLPAPPFLAALRFDQDSLGFTEVTPDSDGRLRHIYASYPTSAGAVSGLAQTLLRRAQVASMPPVVVLTPRRHLETQLPTYALIDVLRCAQEAPESLRLAFTDKIVLVGSTLPEEDRWVSSGRFLAPQSTAAPPIHPCGLHRLGASVPQSETVPGVFLQAAAIEAVVRHEVTTITPPIALIGATAITAAAGTASGLWLTPWLALAVVGSVLLLCFFVSVWLLMYHLWLPLALPGAALVITPALAYVVRYLIEARQRQRLEYAFGHYLAPALVTRLARDASDLRLGGEQREVTVMFADLSGFTAVSEHVPAEMLMHTTNQYLGYMVEQVEASGGYVDKFLGDAVLALWGAPVRDTQHAVHGVQAALAVAARLYVAYQHAAAHHTIGFTVKIGLNSGTAMIGNVGTPRRYNYTAVGETVNVASRLESVPPLYACQIVIGPDTATLVQHAFLLCELDTIRVRGKTKPLTIFAPLAARHLATPAQQAYVDGFALALAHYRAMRFATAASLWEQLPPIRQDTPQGHVETSQGQAHPAAIMAQRARTYSTHPPTLPWDGVWELSSK